MAIPVLAWLSPIDSPATVADGHILKNLMMWIESLILL
jgi:hypothetical protein